MKFLVCLLMCSSLATAQWHMQESHSTAGLRGIHAVNDRSAWASGTEGTILRTTDGGAHWQRCVTPPDAEKLDFRAIWAWSAEEAEVMSAGPGDLSRVYKTTDACKTWLEVARNADKDGFWDALVYRGQTGILIGDPVRGHFDTRQMSFRRGASPDDDACAANPSEGAFAASNSSVFVFGDARYVLVTGGKSGPRALLSPRLAGAKACTAVALPLASSADSVGAFSVYFRDRKHGVIVGGDYKKPEDTAGTATWSRDGGKHWHAAAKLPHGYRSSVTWDPQHKQWVAVGPNGSDTSDDDGKTWKPLDDGNWNAVSLPFVVGPNGSIARLK